MSPRTVAVVDRDAATRHATAASPAWRRLAVRTGSVAAIGHLGISVTYQDLDALAVAAILGLALALTRVRRGTVGMIVLGLAFGNVGFWTVPATMTNAVARPGFAAVAVPGVMAVLSIAGLVASVASLLRSQHGIAGVAGSAKVAATAGVGILIVLAVAVLPGGSAGGPEPGDHVVMTDANAFSPPNLEVEAGTVGIYVQNGDYFWHTFTVHELGVDVRVPVGGSGRVTFEAPAGTYEFVCAIPGHETAGMIGTLTVAGG
jgi:plastocyanin